MEVSGAHEASVEKVKATYARKGGMSPARGSKKKSKSE